MSNEALLMTLIKLRRDFRESGVPTNNLDLITCFRNRLVELSKRQVYISPPLDSLLLTPYHRGMVQKITSLLESDI
jgi:hypothetical protein